MSKLLMITGLGSARDLASGRRGAFYNTLEEFSRYWDRIDVISPRIPNSESRITNLFGNVYVHVSPWPLAFHPFWFLKKALEIYKKHKFDLMTVHDFPPFYNGIAARILWHKIKVPYVLEIHHIPGYPRAAGVKEEIYRSLSRVFLAYDARKAVAVRAVNKEQSPEFLIESGIPKKKINYMPSIYLDTAVFRPKSLAKEYDFIFVGRLEKNKGLDLLMDSFRLLVTKYDLTDIKLMIIGEGPLKNYCKSKIESWKLQNNIFLHGWAGDSGEISEMMNKSRALVMTSYNEGGPRVVAEAMACGIPVLATEVGIVPDFIREGKPGIIGIDWSAEDIAEKIFRFLRDPDRYIAMAAEISESVREFEKKTAISNYAQKLRTFIES